MNNIVRPVASVLITLLAVTMLLTYGKQSMHSAAADELDYAMRVATQDATSKLMDENYLFGSDSSSQLFATDIEAAAKQFVASFQRNTPSGRITDIDVSFSGVAGMWAIYGQYSNGSVTPPFGYTFYADLDPLQIGDRTQPDMLYEFSLGDAFRETDLTSGVTVDKKLCDLSEGYFSSRVSNGAFHDISVMFSINDFLNAFYSSEDANVSVRNAGNGLQFNLGLFDYADDSPAVLNNLSSVIDGPGYFAVVDYYDTYIDQRARVFSISSAELVRTN